MYSISTPGRNEWDALVKRSATATYFQTPACMDVYSSLSFLEGFVFAVYKNEQLLGVMCGYIIANGGRLKQYFSKRAIVPGGLLLEADIPTEAIQTLLKHAIKKLHKRAIYIEIRNYVDYSPYKTTFIECGFDYHAHLNYQVPTPSMDEVMKNVHASKLRQIKSALGAGVSWEETTKYADIEVFYQLLKDLYATKIGKPLFPISFFEQILLQPHAHLLVVKYQEQVIGGMLCVSLENKCVYEWYVCGKDDAAHKKLYPSVMATWAGIAFAVQKGAKYFDFMGAGKPDDAYGVRDFKRKFGGIKVEHGRFLYLCNPLLYKLGKLVVEKIRKLTIKN